MIAVDKAGFEVIRRPEGILCLLAVMRIFRKVSSALDRLVGI